jgi:hypothetical protein
MMFGNVRNDVIFGRFCYAPRRVRLAANLEKFNLALKESGLA